MDAQKKILVLGIGNLLFKDEGIGIQVVRKMEDMALPPDVEVMDGGNLGWDVLYELEGRKKVIVIDSVKADGPPGTLYRFTDKDIQARRKGFFQTVPEQELIDCMNTARLLGTLSDEFVFIGVEPEDTGEKDLKAVIMLSPTLEKKMPEIIDFVMKEIN